MAFRCKVNDGPRPIALQEFLDKFTITNVTVFEGVVWVRGSLLQILQVPSVGEVVEIDDRCPLGRQPLQHKIGPDKSGSSRHYYRTLLHHADPL